MKIKLDKSDISAVDALLADIKNGSKKALTTSLNATLGTIKTQAAKAVGQQYNLKAARIKQNFTLKKANYRDITGYFDATGEPIGLVQYGARQTKKGVSVKVLRQGSRELLKHAYIANGRSKADGTNSEKTHVWWRAKIWGKKVNPNIVYGALPRMYRFPETGTKERGVLRRTGPRIEDHLAKPSIFDALNELASTTFLTNLGKKTEEILRRHG